MRPKRSGVAGYSGEAAGRHPTCDRDQGDQRLQNDQKPGEMIMANGRKIKIVE